MNYFSISCGFNNTLVFLNLEIFRYSTKHQIYFSLNSLCSLSMDMYVCGCLCICVYMCVNVGTCMCVHLCSVWMCPSWIYDFWAMSYIFIQRWLTLQYFLMHTLVPTYLHYNHKKRDGLIRWFSIILSL